MHRRIALSLLFVALLAGSALLFLAQPADSDPIAKFRNADGGITIPGGQFTRELQQLLFGPGPSATLDYTVWLPARSSYATIAWEGHEFSQPNLNVFTRSSKPVADAPRIDLLSPIVDAVRYAFSFDWLIGRAMAVNRFAVFNDAECTTTAASTDADCWSTTSGGNGDGAPVSGDSLVLDTGVSPFTATGTMDANLSLGAQTVTLCSAAGAPIAACGGNFTGTFAISTFSLTFTGALSFNDSGGTVSISTGTIDGGAATFTSAADLSITGAATITFDSMDLNGGTYAKGTSTLTIDAGNLTLGGGDLTSTSGAVAITGVVNISSAASAIDFGSETWTITHATGNGWTNASTDSTWDAGTGTVVFDGGAASTMTFAGTNLSEDEFNNLTLNSTAAMTYTMATRGLRYGGTLSITDTTTSVTLDTSGSNLAITGGGLTLGTNGVLTLNGSTVTANAAWNFSSGTYNEGTSTLVVATSLTVTPNSVGFPGVNISSFTVNVSTTATLATNDLRPDRAATVTINGTLTGGARALDIAVDGAPATPLAVGASGSISGLAIVGYTGCNNATYSVNLPSPAAFPSFRILGGDATAGCDLAGFGASQIATFNATANITISNAFTLYNADGGAGGDFDMDLTATNYSLTVTGATSMGQSSGNDAVLNLRASTVTFTGAITLGVSAAFITTGAATVTASAAYTNSSTNAADWNVTAGTWTFDSATGATLTFAGANMDEAEFNSITFTSSAGTAQTFTMATRGLRWLTTLTVSDTSSTTALATADLALGAAADAADIVVGNGGILTANASTVIINGFTMTGGTSGTLTITTGAWTVSGNWNSSGASSVFTQGTGIHTFDATATITLLSTDNTFDDLTISGGTVTLATAVIVTNGLIISGGTFAKSTFAITSAGSLTMSGGDLTSTSGAVAITGAVNISSALSAIDFGSEAWTVSGAWTNASTDGTVWEAGSGTVTFNSTSNVTMTFAGTNLAEDEFSGVTFTYASAVENQNVTYTLSTRGLRWGGTLTIESTSSAFNYLEVAVNDQTLTGGALTVNNTAAGTEYVRLTTGTMTVTTVSLSSALAFLILGSGSHTVSGTWTNATTTTDWNAGTGTVTFTSSTGGTMTFAGANLAEAEFNSVTFTSSAGTAQTFTMATRGLRWLTTLTVSDTSSTTALASADLALGVAADAADIVVGNGGILTANASTVLINGFTMTGGTSGTLTITTGAWTVSGNWNSSGASSVFTQGTGIHTFDATATITLLSTDNTFDDLTISGGTVTLATAVVVTNALTISGGTFAKSTFAITSAGSLTMSGGDLTSTSGAVAVTGAVNISSASSAIDFGSETWTLSGAFDCESTDTAVWEAGTGLVLFDSATGDSTFTPCNFTSENHFWGVEFDSSATTAQTWTLVTRTLVFGGTMTIEDSGAEAVSNVLNTGVNIAITGGAITVGTGGTLTANASTLTVNGNWNSRNGTFTYGTSTIVFASNGTLTVPVWASQRTVYNVTINASVSMTVPDAQDSVGIVNVLTINGTLIFGTGATLEAVSLFNDAGLTAPLVLGGAAAFTGTIDRAEIEFFDQAGTLVNIPAANYGNVFFKLAPAVAVAGDGFEYRLAGNTTVDRITFTTRASAPFFLNTQTFNLTVKDITDETGATVNYGIKATSGTWTHTGGIVINDGAQSAGFYLQLGSIAWNITGTAPSGFAWSLASVTVGANWNVGTSTVTFSASGGAAFRFAAGGNNFNNVTFQSSSGSADRFYAFTNDATNPLRAAGTMTVSDTVSTTEFDVLNTGTPINITVGVMTVGAGGILTGESSTITVTGNWSSSAGTFTVGTSTVSIEATASIAAATTSSFYNLTITTGTSTPSTNIDVDNTFTISGGTYAKGTTTLNVDGGLTMSGGDLTSTSGDVTITGAVNISSTASAISFGGETWTMSGAYTNASTDAAGWASGSAQIVFNSSTAQTMTFAGANLAETEFDRVRFASTAAGSVTFTMATRGLNIGGLLAMNSDTVLDKATFTIDAAGGMTIGDSGASALVSTSGAVTITGNASISNATSYIDFGSEAWTVTGTWTNSSTSASWDAGSGTVTFNSATGGTMTFAGANLAEAEFSSVTFNSSAGGSQTFTMATRGLSWSGTLTVTGDTILAKATFTLGAEASGALTVGGTGGNALTSTSGAVTVSTVSVSGTTDYIDLGSEAWTVSGTWTNATTSASWDAGTGTVTFTSATGGTMTFAGANLAEAEFSSVTFNSSAAGSQTFTMATRGLSWSGTLTITGDTILAKATFTLGAEASGALTVGGAGTNALTSTSGAVTVTTVSVSGTGDYIDLGSEAWTVSGDWDNSSTSASWDAGTGTVTFTSTTAQSMTFATFTTWEAEFDSATFNSSAATAITFTGAGGPLGFATTLTITDSSSTTTLALTTVNIRGDTSATIDMTDADGRLTFTTGDIVDVSDLNITGGQMTMDGVSGITDIRIQAAGVDDFDITAWTLYSITGGGVPDIRWTMDPDAGNTNITVTTEGVTALTTFSIYRDGIDILQAASTAGGVVTFTGGLLNSGWSSHTMIIALPGLTFGGGGGGGGPVPEPTILWTWRHLSDDLTIEFVVQGPITLGVYEWEHNGKIIGKGNRIEYTFPFSGVHTIILHAKVLDFTVDTSQQVTAKSVTFLGRYFPVLALVLIGLWYIILVLAETYKSDAGRLYGMSVALVGFGAAVWLVTSVYRTFPMTSISAFQVIGGIALLAAGGAVKSRLAALALSAAGAVLMVMVYLFVVPAL